MDEQDYDAAIEAVRRQRDEALHKLEASLSVAREVLAMERLGMSIALLGPVNSRWVALVEQSLKVIG